MWGGSPEPPGAQRRAFLCPNVPEPSISRRKCPLRGQAALELESRPTRGKPSVLESVLPVVLARISATPSAPLLLLRRRSSAVRISTMRRCLHLRATLLLLRCGPLRRRLWPRIRLGPRLHLRRTLPGLILCTHCLLSRRLSKILRGSHLGAWLTLRRALRLHLRQTLPGLILWTHCLLSCRLSKILRGSRLGARLALRRALRLRLRRILARRSGWERGCSAHPLRRPHWLRPGRVLPGGGAGPCFPVRLAFICSAALRTGHGPRLRRHLRPLLALWDISDLDTRSRACRWNAWSRRTHSRSRTMRGGHAHLRFGDSGLGAQAAQRGGNRRPARVLREELLLCGKRNSWRRRLPAHHYRAIAH